MPILAITRHGQSLFNLENRFTGLLNAPLTKKGKTEAAIAGEKLKPFHFDIAFTSKLYRAQETLHIILDKLHMTGHIPVYQNAALNERDYGALSGLNKAETALKYGKEQVALWRRSFDVAPPNGESLKDTYNRVIPYYREHIAPLLLQGKNVLIAAHGNSMRALMMYLENISADNIENLNLPTGTPRIYDMDPQLHIEKAYYVTEEAPEFTH